MAKKYCGDAFAAIHETMEALHKIGAVDKQTMREFDDACLTPVRVLAPDEIKAISLREHISQLVFARYLIGTSSGLSTIGCTSSFFCAEWHCCSFNPLGSCSFGNSSSPGHCRGWFLDRS